MCYVLAVRFKLLTVSGFLCVGCGPQVIVPEGDSTTIGESTNPQQTTVIPTTGEPEPLSCAGLAPVLEEEFPDQIAAAVCARKAACGCANDADPECQIYKNFFGEARAFANGKALAYDGQCVAKKIQSLAGSGCTAQDALDGLDCGECWIYLGEVQGQQECAISYFIDNMIAQVCKGEDDSCYSVSGEGLLCRPPASEGEVCGTSEHCLSGLVCGNGECVSAEIDEPCFLPPDDLPECPPGARCDESMTCQPLLPLGADCSSNSMCQVANCESGTCTDFERVCLLEPPYL